MIEPYEILNIFKRLGCIDINSLKIDELTQEINNLIIEKISKNSHPVAYIDSLSSHYPSCIKSLNLQSESEKIINKAWFPVYTATINMNSVVEELRKDKNYLQAKIDSLMLEYCPEDMTKDQLETWAANQKQFG